MSGDIASKSVGNGSLQAGNGSLSTDIVAMPVGSDPLQRDIVPMSSGIVSMSVDIGPLPGDGDWRRVESASRRLAMNRCQLTLLRCKRTGAAVHRHPSIARRCRLLQTGVALEQPASAHSLQI
jgi:hypothetical protein